MLKRSGQPLFVEVEARSHGRRAKGHVLGKASIACSLPYPFFVFLFYSLSFFSPPFTFRFSFALSFLVSSVSFFLLLRFPITISFLVSHWGVPLHLTRFITCSQQGVAGERGGGDRRGGGEGEGKL